MMNISKAFSGYNNNKRQDKVKETLYIIILINLNKKHNYSKGNRRDNNEGKDKAKVMYYILIEINVLILFKHVSWNFLIQIKDISAKTFHNNNQDNINNKHKYNYQENSVHIIFIILIKQTLSISLLT